MKNNKIPAFLIVFIPLMLLPGLLVGQTWKFIKEKDGVQLFTRDEKGKNLKFIKGVAEFSQSAEKIYALIEDVNHTEWWDSNLKQIKVLQYEKNKHSQLYMVYSMPWPFKSRDMSVNMTTTINQMSGEYKVIAVPLSGVTPEIKDFVRIKEYRQIWTLKPVNNKTHIELEFYVDPVENIPAWLLNMILIDTPINSIKALRQMMEKK